MNLFGMDIKLAKTNGGNGYVKRTELDQHCEAQHKTMNEHSKERYISLEKQINDLRGHMNIRFDDLKELIRSK